MYFPELLAGLEPPLEEEPISPERHAKNITDLFGDPSPEVVRPPGIEAPQPAQGVTSPPPATSEPTPRQETPPAILEPPGSPELPAGQAGFTWIAQIEAAVIAGGGNLAAIWGWAEKKRKKPATQFSVHDLQWLLKEVRESKRNKSKNATPPPGPVATETPMSMVEVPTEEEGSAPVDTETGEVLEDDAPLSPVASAVPGDDEDTLWPPQENDPF